MNMNTGNINFKGTIQQVENGKPYPARNFNNDKAVLNLFEHRVSTEKIADVSTNAKDTVSFSLGSDTQVSMKPEINSGLVLTITKMHDEANKTIIKLFESCERLELGKVFDSVLAKVKNIKD